MLCFNDKSLMEIFTQEHDITTAVKTSINKVRGCLAVFTLAEIATGEGTKILPCFASGIKIDTKSNWDWHEERPSVLDSSRWKVAMLLLVDETAKLHAPLGKRISLTHHDLIWLYSMNNENICRKGPTQWKSYVKG